jgi:2-oxoglutarate dehydrogenase E1 component
MATATDIQESAQALFCALADYHGVSNIDKVFDDKIYPSYFEFKTFWNKKYPNATEQVWAQEEPQNQGAWFQIQHNIFENLAEGQKLAYSGRPASASPAVGYYDKHYAQQKALIDTAFSKLKGFILTK